MATLHHERERRAVRLAPNAAERRVVAVLDRHPQVAEPRVELDGGETIPGRAGHPALRDRDERRPVVRSLDEHRPVVAGGAAARARAASPARRRAEIERRDRRPRAVLDAENRVPATDEIGPLELAEHGRARDAPYTGRTKLQEPVVGRREDDRRAPRAQCAVDVVDGRGREPCEAAAAAVGAERRDVADEVPAGDPSSTRSYTRRGARRRRARPRRSPRRPLFSTAASCPIASRPSRTCAPRHLVPLGVDDADVGEAPSRMTEHRAVGLERHASRGDCRRQLRACSGTRPAERRPRPSRPRGRDELHDRPPPRAGCAGTRRRRRAAAARAR